MRGTIRAIIVCACVAPNACSGGGNAPTARFKLSGDTPPNLLDVPFPTDAYLSNGHIIDPLPGADALIPRQSKYLTHELGKTNGFGIASFAVFYVDDPSKPVDTSGNPAFADIDPASLPVNEDACVADASSVFLIDLAPADPLKARVRCRGRIHDDNSTSGAQPVVAVGPGQGIVLQEGHPYAAVLTSRLKDKSGAHVVASADFQGLLSGKRAGTLGTLYGSAIDKVLASIGSALKTDGSQIVAIAPYTTQSTSAEMFKLRESLEDAPVPTLAWDAPSMVPMGATRFAALAAGVLPAGFTASLDAWLGVAPKLGDGSDDPDYLTTGVIPHDKIAAIGTAVFQAASFLLVKPGGYTDLDHATFARDGSGNIVPSPDRPKVPIWVSLAIPTAPMPAGGYPCVIVGHGLPGSRAEAFMHLANALNAKGWIVAAIDMVTNGARAPEAKYQVDQLTDWQNAPGATYKGPDGLADNVDSSGQPAVMGSRNGNLDMVGLGLNFGSLRDQTRQQEIDISQLARVLASNPDLSPLQTGATPPKIDKTKIAYVGGSYGAITGAVVAAFEPNIRSWVLNVGAGHFLSVAKSSPGTEAALKGGLVISFGVTGQFLEETNPLMAIAQITIDAMDPLTYASYLVSHPGSIKGTPLQPRNILGIEVLYDETVGNDGTEQWARAVGMGLAVPNVGANAGVSTMDQVRDPTKVPDRIALPDVSPDGSQLIHDTPIAGVTAVLVQASPATHYRNLLESKGMRSYSVPFNAATVPLTTQYFVRHAYLEQQAMMTRFFEDAFAGNVPNVTGFKPPVRDVDDDGNPDATDPDPNDPTVK